LEGTLTNLHSWGKQKFGNLPKKIREAQEDLQGMNEQNSNVDLMELIKTKEKEIDTLLQQEEMWWSQSSRVLWLKHGDKNTSFFHKKASHRRKKNMIDAITDRMGHVQTVYENIETTFINHFKDLFTSQDTIHIPEIVDVVKNNISEDMYNYIQKEFTKDEVFNAIKDIKGLTAPGPDGLPALFYQTYWDIIGNDVTEVVLKVLNHMGSTKAYNHTHIFLIPNNNNPTHPSDYRPISLCNVTLKIITKTIANRLKLILPNIISHNQSTFVPGRLITDNTLVAYETFPHFNHNNIKQGYMGVKTDMANAYDRIEWIFLQNTFEAMGFPHHLTDTIMECVFNVTFPILINGNPSKPFSPQRGLRQGDPISPYLFICCANVLSGLMLKAQQQKMIHGIKIAHSAPEVSHLLFADDSLFFCTANKEEAQTIKNVITNYQEASGQFVNMEKYEIIFSKYTPQRKRNEIHSILPRKVVPYFKKYLRMPTHVGRSKRQVFDFIQDKVWNKLNGWKEKHVSFAGRRKLIKAVAQAIPTYIMSCFLLQKNLCQHIENMIHQIRGK
jgi:hypothetical protein